MVVTSSSTLVSSPSLSSIPSDRCSGPFFVKRILKGHKVSISTRLSPVKKQQTLQHGLIVHTSTPPLSVGTTESPTDSENDAIGFIGIHHVGIICENLERSLEFYCSLLGLETCPLRPDKRLRYRGAWLWAGNQMIHLMELPNPDPVAGRPAHGGEDRHICVSIQNPMRLKAVLEGAGIPYTMSKSGRPVIFFRDPDGNALECQPSYMHETARG